jgi:hypothetical protein
VRLEEDRARSIMPGPPHPEQDLRVVRQFERVLGDGWAQDVSAQVLESLSVACWHGDASMEVETAEVSLPLGDGCAQCRIQSAADP